MRRDLQLILLTTAFGLLLGVGAARAEVRPEVTWSVQGRDLGFFDWRPRLALGSRGAGWIGGDRPPGTSGGLLYRLQQGAWTPWTVSRVQEARTFVLAVDPAGGLWLCLYPPSDEATYGGLRIRRYDGRRWREEVAAPGIWPQAMAMVSPDEGWIGGNKGMLLHRVGGRWQRVVLPLSEEERKGMDVLALRMSGPDEGWLVGTQGLVAHFSGGRWQKVEVPPALRSEKIFALDVTVDGSLWVAGSRGLLARLDSHGWQRFTVPHPFDLLGLDMVSPGDGWVVGKYGTILRWDGKTWRQQVSPTFADLFDVAMTTAGEGWIVGNDVLLHSSPGRWPLLRDASLSGRYPMARQPAEEIASVDVDGDGDLDLFLLQPTSLQLYENRGKEGFYEVPRLSALPLSLFRSAAWGDVEGDGDLDLLVLSASPAAAWLYRNLGGLRFAPPERLPVEPLDGNDAAAFIDLDGDGDLDLYVARSSDSARQTNLVYLNDGVGRFRLADDSGGSKGSEAFTLWGDLDNDLDLDAVLPGGGNQELTLLINQKGRLRDATAGSGLDEPLRQGKILQGALLDLDRDGDLDLLLLDDRLYVFLNDGKAHFRRDDALFDPVVSNPAVASSLSSAGDLDHDGYPEVLLQTVDGGRRAVRLLSRRPDGRYHDAVSQLGLTDLTGHAAVFTDLDGDGDLDLYIAGAERGYLIENLENGAGHLTLRLHGDHSNRSAVGAGVRIYVSGHLGEPAFLRGYQQAGVGFNPSGSQNLSALYFGVDPRGHYDIEVTFPSGRQVVEHGVKPGRTLDVDESPPGLRQLVLGWRWGRRAWLVADLRREGVKLGLVLLMLGTWCSGVSRRFRLAVLLFGVYLLTAAGLAADPRPVVHVVQLLGFGGVLGLLSWIDRRLAAWRSAHHLGSYRLQEMLGEGGMGVVYRARNVVTGKTVALKVLHPRMTEREEHRIRFLREGQILTRLEHANIVKVFETGEVDGRGYISMELLDGLSLRGLIRQWGPLPPAAVRDLLSVCCDALAYVHGRGIVHRDVKSENLWLLEPDAPLPVDEAGWRRRLRLMDFGLAHASDLKTLTDRTALLGTLAYLPPEQLQGQTPDARSDLYSLGVVAFEASTGRLPCEAEDEGSLRAGIPSPLTRLIARMLARSPRDRPSSAEALAAELAALEHPRPSSPRPSSPVPSHPPHREKRETSKTAPTGFPSPDGEEAGEGTGVRARSSSTSSGIWGQRYREAQSRLEEGRTTEAHVLMMECLADLRQVLLALDRDQQESYCRKHSVQAAVELMDRLSD